MKLLARLGFCCDHKKHGGMVISVMDEWRFHQHIPRCQVPISWGCVYGHYHMVEYLLSCGGDLHYQNEFPLHLALHNNHMDIILLLIDYGANVNAYDGYALRRAASKGQMDVVRFLIERGACVKHETIEFALRNKHVDIACYLAESCGSQQMISMMNMYSLCKQFLIF